MSNSYLNNHDFVINQITKISESVKVAIIPMYINIRDIIRIHRNIDKNVEIMIFFHIFEQKFYANYKIITKSFNVLLIKHNYK